MKWHWKYTVQKEPYDDEAKEYLTKKALKMSETRWEALDVSQREELLAKDLWIEENCEVCPAVAAHPMRNLLQWLLQSEAATLKSLSTDDMLPGNI